MAKGYDGDKWERAGKLLYEVPAIAFAWATWIVLAVLILLAAINLLGLQGWLPRTWPRVDPQAVAWLCGAWWLYRGSK